MPGTVVYVKNISSLLDESHLRELFECCGVISSIHLDSSSPENRFCKIDFAEEEHASAAICLSGTPLGDRPIQVDQTPPFDAQAGPAANSLAAQQASGVDIPPQMMAAAQRRDEEVRRTIYVGNVNPIVQEEDLRNFFNQSGAGGVKYVKIVGKADQMVRYSFVEFDTAENADRAKILNGSMFAERQIKVGAAQNPIINHPGKPSVVAGPTPVELSASMQKVREAQEAMKKRLAEKMAKKSESGGDDKEEKKRRSRSRSRGRRRRRSRSRDRHRRRRRSRSRSRDRYRRRRRSRSRSRGRYRPRGGGGGRFGGGAKKKNPNEGKVWDGYQWHDPQDLEPSQMDEKATMRAAIQAQQAIAQMQVKAGFTGKVGTAPS